MQIIKKKKGKKKALKHPKDPCRYQKEGILAEGERERQSERERESHTDIELCRVQNRFHNQEKSD
jgi:hypothetical protein